MLLPACVEEELKVLALYTFDIIFTTTDPAGGSVETINGTKRFVSSRGSPERWVAATQPRDRRRWKFETLDLVVGMAKQRLTYWLPRALVIGFCLSLLLPAPAFLSVMDDSQMVVWAARLIWVVGLPAVFAGVADRGHYNRGQRKSG